ncbi:hypothetical protein [Sporosarcina highlanderae]|uniref:Uncharacterized protein n=1 Tax=Sporosarcina highlanderae TaxID=3035916 RepID=A0ABT8JQS0_9BACL|nr:hypothetical protein [Sporosarcina highlanderae]MDN4607362.1 hypothetical protein [Sporosarcina highlanderae]
MVKWNHLILEVIAMVPHDDLRKFAIEISENLLKIRDAFLPYQQFQESLVSAISNLKFPKIEFPEFEIDWERIESLIKYNSSHGWTLSGEMDTNFYLDQALLGLEQVMIDALFFKYFESDSKKNYYSTKSTIIGEIDKQWKSVLIDCFELYEQDKYRVIIPMLISIIEGQVSGIAKSPEVGTRLLRVWRKQITSQEERMMIIVSYSLNEFLASKIFVRREFHEERGTTINRNWVLHGRDNPEYWTRVDALKLINVISTLQYIKEFNSVE